MMKNVTGIIKGVGSMDINKEDIDLISLHGHYTNYLDILTVQMAVPPKPKDMSSVDYKANIVAREYQNIFFRAIAYSLLYVVIEGYQQLRLDIRSINNLLEKSDYVDGLWKLRNGIFHYQESPNINKKLDSFLGIQGHEIWIEKVTSAFNDFFSSLPKIKQMESKGIEVIKKILLENKKK